MAYLLAFLKAVPQLAEAASQALQAWKDYLDRKALEEREEIRARQRELGLQIIQVASDERRAELARRLSELERRRKPGPLKQ